WSGFTYQRLSLITSDFRSNSVTISSSVSGWVMIGLLIGKYERRHTHGLFGSKTFLSTQTQRSYELVHSLRHVPSFHRQTPELVVSSLGGNGVQCPLVLPSLL